MSRKCLYIIAGEVSGDSLGGNLLSQMSDYDWMGVGGARMKVHAYFDPFFDSSELSIMGLIELIPHIPRMLRLINQTVDHIIQNKPRALITIDAPDFTHRVVKKLRAHPEFQADPFPCIHIGAPTVWAWRAGRAQKMAQLFDMLLTLFPFEPPYFPDLPTHFVGHPIADRKEIADSQRDKNQIALLPGSRVGELKRHVPLFYKVVDLLPEWHFDLLTLPHLKSSFQEYGDMPSRCTLHTHYDLSSAYMALAASGTVCLDLAQTKTPMITTYKTNPLTAFIAKRLVHTPYVNLINIINQRWIVPELIQQDATPITLAQALQDLAHPDTWTKQHQTLGATIEQIKSPYGSFGESTQEYIERLIG